MGFFEHFSVSEMQVSKRGLQTLCFDLWLNRINDLRRLAFREQRLAIRPESCHVYTLRGVSGWVCSAEILWENREVHPASWPELNVKCRYAAEQCGGHRVSDEKCPPVCSWSGPTELPEHISILLFSTQTTHSTNIFYIACTAFQCQRTLTSYHIFNFIAKKGVVLIMVMEWTITGFKFPFVPC